MEQLNSIRIKRHQQVYGDVYWFVTDYGSAKSNVETGHKRDIYRFKTGNYYAIEAEAQAALEALLNL